MKNKISSFKIGLLLIGALLAGNISKAATYTAVASGYWSSAATWGGTKAPFNLGATDQVTIGSGFTIIMDSTVTLNGLLSQLSVSGTLSSSLYTLTVTSGTLTGSGNIDVNNIMLNAGGTFSFTGTIAAQTITNAIVSLSSAANITVSKTLTLVSAISITTGGALGMSSGSKIVISGGQLDISGGSLNLSAMYDVNYVSSSATVGMELSGSGLRNVDINVGASNSVTLNSNITTNDSLNIISGSLVLSGNVLTINGSFSSDSGSITGDASAGIIVNTSGGIANAFMFASGSQVLNELTINVGSGNSIKLGTALDIPGTLKLSGGSNLDISNQTLTLDDSLMGNGKIMVNGSSSLAIDAATSVPTPINLSGSSIGTFALNIGTGRTVTMGSDLTVSGKLYLQTGTVVLNNHNLSLTGDIVAGSGNIFSTANSNVSITTASSVNGLLVFAYPGNVVNNVSINIGAAGSVKLGADLVVNGTLNFMAGHIDVVNHNLQIAAGGSIAGANSNSYIITQTNGQLTLNATTSGSVTYPVGTATNYFPATITLHTGSSTGDIGVNVTSGVYSQGTSGTKISATEPLVNATWLFETSISSGLLYDMQLTWAPATEVNGFVHVSDYIAHYTSGAWDVSAFENAASAGGGMFMIQRTGLTSMSPFAVFDSSTSPTGVNEITENKEFRIYPNPANEFINVKNDWGTSGMVYVDVLNICGQVVSNFKMDNTSLITLPIKGLASGVYFIRIYNDNLNVVERFIKAE